MADNTPKPTINEFQAFMMYATPTNGSTRSPKLSFGIRDGKPRITVYTNVPEDSDKFYGIINAPMDAMTFTTVMTLLSDIAVGPNDTKQRIDNFTSRRQEDGSYGDKILLSSTMIGKDASGIVWISVISDDDTRPKIKFEFTLSDYHKLVKSDGTPYSKAEASVLVTRGLTENLPKMIMPFMSGFSAKGNARPTNNQSSGNNTFTLSEDIPY